MQVWLFEEAAYKRVPAVKERNEHGRRFDGAVGIGSFQAVRAKNSLAELALGDVRFERVSEQVGVRAAARADAGFEFLLTPTSPIDCCAEGV